MTDKPTKPKPPLTPAKRAGKIAELTVMRDQALNDCAFHASNVSFNENLHITPQFRDIEDAIKGAAHSLAQAKAAQKKLDALGAK